jgi:nicotinamidase-related amidase
VNLHAPALLVIDVQHEYFDPESPLVIPDGPAVLLRLSELMSAFREAEAAIIHVHHQEAAEAEVFAAGSENVVPMAEVAPLPGEPVVVKSMPGAFDGTDLDAVLEENGAKTLVVAGFMTHMCCDSTAREAQGRGYEVLFLSDGTATRDLVAPSGRLIPHADVHETVLAAHADGISTVTDVRSVRDALG